MLGATQSTRNAGSQPQECYALGTFPDPQADPKSRSTVRLRNVYTIRVFKSRTGGSTSYYIFYYTLYYTIYPITLGVLLLYYPGGLVYSPFVAEVSRANASVGPWFGATLAYGAYWGLLGSIGVSYGLCWPH